MFSKKHLTKTEQANATLLKAIPYNDYREIQAALAQGGNPDISEQPFLNTALHRFSSQCDLDGIVLMVDGKANVNADNQHHQTPLDMVALNGKMRGEAAQMAAAKFLLVAGAEVTLLSLRAAGATGSHALAAYLERIALNREVRPVNADLVDEYGRGFGQPVKIAQIDRIAQRRSGNSSSSCHGV